MILLTIKITLYKKLVFVDSKRIVEIEYKQVGAVQWPCNVTPSAASHTWSSVINTLIMQ